MSAKATPWSRDWIAALPRRRVLEPLRAWWRGSTRHTQLWILWVLSLSALYLLWLGLLPQPVLLTTVTATVERVEIEATDRTLSAVPIAGMRAALGTGPALCRTGVLAPDVGAVIVYERGRPLKRPSAAEGSEPPLDGASITLSNGGGVFTTSDGSLSQPVAALAEFIVDEACQEPADGAGPHRLPIWGRLRLGEEIKPLSASGRIPLGLLLEGKLTVQARAVENAALVPGGASTLYPVQTMDLPVGARVQARDFAEAVWWGTVYVDPQKPGLQMLASTEAPALAVFRPGRTEPDMITVTALTRIFSDPNILRIQVVLLVLLGIVQAVSVIIPDRR